MRVFVPSAAALLTDRRGHGEGLIAWTLFAGLAARGHELVVCARTLDLHGEPPFETIEMGWASRFESVEPLAYARAVRKVFKRLGGADRFDVVHWLFPQEPFELLYAPPRNVPYVIGPYGPRWPRLPRSRPLRPGDVVRFLTKPLFDVRYRRAITAADALLAATPEGAAAFPSFARVRPVSLPFAVDTGRFRSSEPPREGPVLFTGKLERAKGVRELVEAFARVRSVLPSSRLVLAGEGPERSWIEGRARELGLNGSLELLGAVPHSQIPALLRSASLLCLPSHGEPFGMALLEAMAAGRPVVAADAGGPAFLVDRERGGRLFELGNTAALAAALHDLLADPNARVAMGRFNSERAESVFSLNSVLDRLESVYERVVFP